MKSFCYLLIVLFSAPFASQSQTIALFYDGITTGLSGSGEEIPITSFQNGFVAPGDNLVQHSDYTITKNYDQTSLRIMDNLAKKTLGPRAEIRFYNGEKNRVKTIKLENVRITSYSTSGTPCDFCPGVMESVSISFQTIEITDHGTNQVFKWSASSPGPK